MLSNLSAAPVLILTPTRPSTRYRMMAMLRFRTAWSSGLRLTIFIALCICVLQAVAVVLEKGNLSIGQLTLPEIEDKLQVLQPGTFWHSDDNLM